MPHPGSGAARSSIERFDAYETFGVVVVLNSHGGPDLPVQES
jgi:hypothetical protein